MTVSITIKSDWRSIEKELKRLEKAPLRARAFLDAALDTGFAATQSAVHVITGSLKSSGKKTSDMHGDTWRGQISYGGVSIGVNNPVTYAIYEKARGAGGAGGESNAKGDHDFMAPLASLDSLYVKAILKVLS